MPRSGSGTYTLPSGNPVVTGTTIESNWANTTLSDIATTLSDSLSRSGQGGMTAALRVADGTQGAPGVGFANETGSGFYRAGTGEVWAVVQGAQTLNLDANGVYVPADKTTTVDGAFVFNEAGADKDARFEGDTDANLLVTDASTDRVGVGTNAPATKLTVRGATQNKEVALRWERATDGAVAGGLGYFYDSENSLAVGSVTNHPFKIITNDATVATFDSSGNLGLGVTPSAWQAGAKAVEIGGNGYLAFTGNAVGGYLYSNAYFTGTNTYKANGFAAAYGLGVSGQHIWYTAPSGTAGNAITFTQAMTLTSGGNLLVGTTSGSDRLVVSDSVSNKITITGGTTQNGITFAAASSSDQYYVFSGDYNTVKGWGVFNVTDNNLPLWINEANEVLVGNSTTDQGAYNLQCAGTGVWGAGAYVNGSDERLKDNIQSLDSCLDIVAALHPVTFQYKPEHSKDQSVQPGFIAQELQQAMAGKPYLEGVVQSGPEYLNVAYQNLIPILTKAIQEQQALITALTARVAALEAA